MMLSGARRLRTFHEAALNKKADHIRLSYYGGGHYDSVTSREYSVSLLNTLPGVAEDQTLGYLRLVRTSEGGDGVQKTEDRDNAVLAEALRESRAGVYDWGSIDLEKCLSLSTATSAGTAAADVPGKEESKLIITPCDILGEVVAESERAFIEQALVDAVLTQQIQTEVTNGSEDPEGTLTVNTLQRQEEDDLQRALRMSSELGGYYEQTLGVLLSEEDDELQRALAASFNAEHHTLRSSSSSASGSYGSGDGYGARVICQGSNEEEVDSDLQRAIAESLHHNNAS
jgi:hypothetical protein